MVRNPINAHPLYSERTSSLLPVALSLSHASQSQIMIISGDHLDTFSLMFKYSIHTTRITVYRWVIYFY